MSTKFACPHCGQELQVEVSAGAYVRCPSCNKPFKVGAAPAQNGQTAQAPRQDAPPPKYPGAPFVRSFILAILAFPIGLPALLFCALASGARKAGNDRWAATFAHAARSLILFALLLLLAALFVALVSGLGTYLAAR